MKKILTSLVAFASFMYGDTMLNINLNEKDLEGFYEDISSVSSNTNVYKSIGYISAEDEYENKNGMVEGELLVAGMTSLPGLSVGMGVRGFAANLNGGNMDKTAGALAIKVKGIYTLPVVVKSYATVSYAYAPDSLSFSDLENYSETRIEANFELIEGGIIYGGVRSMDMKFKNVEKKYSFNNGAYIGIRFILSR